jgi:hypothetical protein
VLEEEYARLHPSPDEALLKFDADEEPEGASGRQARGRRERRLTRIIDAIHGREHSALCLSGGGIRSATFALGVLQGLARRNLIGRFDYLSTVSGGGYVGSWLSAWIHRDPEGVEGVMRKLNEPTDQLLVPVPEPVRHLRSYSNYLTPRLGVLSGDTWTVAAIIVRNLVLNWLVLIPFLLAALVLPRLLVAFTHYRLPESLGVLTLTLPVRPAGVWGMLALAFAAASSPSLTPATSCRARRRTTRASAASSGSACCRYSFRPSA